jgi:hypothetical protein
MKKFKEIVIPFLKSYDKCWHIIVGMIITSIIIGIIFLKNLIIMKILLLL